MIHYRPRSAIREVGKVLGLTEDVTGALAGTVWGSWGDSLPDEHIRQTGLDPQNPVIRRRRAAGERVDRLSPPPVPACGRVRADRAAAGRDRAHRQRRHGRPHLHRMGQGRYRRPEDHEGRRAGAGDADLHQEGARVLERAGGDDRRHGEFAARPAGRLRHDLQRRHHRRVPDRKPGADEHVAAAEAGQILRPGDRSGDRAAGPDPGRHGASLSEAPVGA